MTLTPQERKRKEAAMLIVKALSTESSVVEKTLSQVDIKNIPNRVEPAIRRWLQQHKGKHEVYGSAAMATHTLRGRQPNDLDIVVEKPRYAAQSLARMLRNEGVSLKTSSKPKWDSYIIQIRDSKGEYKDAIDIHPIKRHSQSYQLYGKSLPPGNKQGITLQSASDQLLRKGNAITKYVSGEMGASPHRNVKDTEDFISTAKLILASMELRSEAKKRKATKVKAAIRTWEGHLKSLKGRATSKRDTFTKPQKKRYVATAMKHPDYTIGDLVFASEKRVVKKKKVVKKPKPKTKKRKTQKHSTLAIDDMMGKELKRLMKW
jgi:hypothetical protein